eukprot:SAG11_NODE_932_length_6489_cov_6.539039_5_plen_183_part_00
MLMLSPTQLSRHNNLPLLRCVCMCVCTQSTICDHPLARSTSPWRIRPTWIASPRLDSSSSGPTFSTHSARRPGTGDRTSQPALSTLSQSSDPEGTVAPRAASCLADGRTQREFGILWTTLENRASAQTGSPCELSASASPAYPASGVQKLVHHLMSLHFGIMRTQARILQKTRHANSEPQRR